MKNRIKNTKKVYHGTISLYEKDIKEKIKLDISKRKTDFGTGFYTTTSYNQAEFWAIRQYQFAVSRKENIGKDIRPIVLEFEFDNFKALQDKYIHIFDNPCDKWYEFIFNNRIRNEERKVSDFHNLNADYNLVFGYMADSCIAEILAEINMNNKGFEYFKNELSPFDEKSDQLSFHTKESLNYISYTKTHKITVPK